MITPNLAREKVRGVSRRRTGLPGGAAMGYHRAGFEVVGVDIKPQPHYPFEFHQADALTYPLDGFDVIHASPPCQAYSVLRFLPWLKDKQYWDSIPPTRAVLEASGLPWVIENVEHAPIQGIVLCGGMFGLPVFRHRRFDSSFLLFAPTHERHRNVILKGRMLKDRARLNVWGKTGVAGHHGGTALKREAMGIPWMTSQELSQAIPPAYTEFIGKQLMRLL